jgi:hypothetical protein
MPSQSTAPLQPSEAQVFEAAKCFFAALLGAGRVSETNQPGIMRYCVRAAQQLVAETASAMRPQPQPSQTDAGDLDLDMELEELAKPEGTAYRSAKPAAPPGGRQSPPSGAAR